MRTFLTFAAAVGVLSLAVPTQASAQTTTPPAANATPPPIAKSANKRRHVKAKHKVLGATHGDRHYHAYGYRAQHQARHYIEWRFSPSSVGDQGR